MIRAGSGLSTLQDSESAGRAAAGAALDQAGCDGADWGLVFATSFHRPGFRDLLRAVCGELRTSRVIGCTGVGVLTHAGEVEGSFGVSVLAVSSDRIKATPFLFRDEGDGGLTAGYEMAATLGSTVSPRDVLVLLPDSYHINPEQLLRSLESKIGHVPVVGASASEDGTIGATYEFCGEEVSSASVSGLRLSGEFTHTVGVTQGCQPIGEPCIVTRAYGNVVVELDGRPALAVLAEQIPRSLFENAPGLLRNLAVALPPEVTDREIVSGEYLVRNLLGFDADRGTFTVAGRIVEGQFLVFALREGETARSDLKRMLETVDPRATGASYRFGLYFNCAARGHSLYRMSGIDTAYLGSKLPDLPIAGFFGNSEIAPLRGVNRLYTYTGVLALFGE